MCPSRQRLTGADRAVPATPERFQFHSECVAATPSKEFSVAMDATKVDSNPMRQEERSHAASGRADGAPGRSACVPCPVAVLGLRQTVHVLIVPEECVSALCRRSARLRTTCVNCVTRLCRRSSDEEIISQVAEQCAQPLDSRAAPRRMPSASISRASTKGESRRSSAHASDT